MKKKIISKTILFIGILIFISLYKAIFGEENSIIGVTTVIAVLILLSENLMVKPMKNFLILLIINLVIGYGS